MVEKETGHTFDQIMTMDYVVFNCHLYWIQQINLEAYKDQLSLFGYTNTTTKPKEQHVTKPDMGAIKRFGGGI